LTKSCTFQKKAVSLQAKMNTLVKNSARLLSANVVAQAIGLVVYPILTRLYSPADFGLLNLFLSISNICTMVALGEYYYAIVLSKDHHQASALVQLCILMLGSMFVLLILTIPFSPHIASLFKTPLLAKYWWLLPIHVMAMGLWNIANYCYIYRSKFKRIATYQLSNSILAAAGKIGFGTAGWVHGGLITASVAAPVLAVISSIAIAVKHFADFHPVSFTECRQAARDYRNFPIFTLPKSCINLLFGYLPVLVLTPIFGSYQVGLWSMALIAGFTPIYFITKTIYQVLYEHFATCVKTNQSILPLMRRFTTWSLCCCLPLFAGLFIILPWLTKVLFGTAWIESGYYIRWMLPWLVMSLLCSSTNFLPDIFFEQKKGLYFEIFLAMARLSGICIGLYYHNFTIAIAGYCLGSAAALLVQFIWLYSLVTRYERTICATTH